MGTVRAAIDIDASPEAVWDVLRDLGRWSEWNDVMHDARCDGGHGSRVSVRVNAEYVTVPIQSRIRIWEEQRALAWGEDRGRVLRVTHGFTLEARDGGTQVVHYESFEGLLGRLAYPVIQRPLTRQYAAFLEALKAEVEGGA